MSKVNQDSGIIYQLVSFVVENEEYGIDILNVQEIIRMMEISRVPNAPDFIEGVINLRGKIVPVVDLRKRFGRIPRKRDKETRIIVVELGEKVVGFLVDQVQEVLRVPKSIIEPPPELAIDIDARYITGVAKLDDRLLILLDLVRVLSAGEHQDLLAFEEVA
ncbi:MAG: chemotaxis protein CheW [Calditrichia bacterium]|nr:chemotaxis protein CheW [Calditrichota bacterium]MCB0266625.1 chemotaxis protein CheW [Calditrichota bacterium]MCB0287241.1 chemotaxis protein CheW [Calditrichota bacterium]MCB9068157.1 chemotaxis protein CheW [Calditrichia bacterium]